MIATVDYIKRCFCEFNRRMFGGRLPEIPVELADAAGFLGKCVFRQSRRPDGLMEYSDFRLRINSRIDLPESVLEDTIIHEMIHYFILWSGLHDTSVHGDIFKAIMTAINHAHGRNISITHKNTPEENENAVSTKRTWHVIAAIYYDDGHTGVKVLPRVAPKIIHYYNVASSQKNITDVRLYFHDNPFFNRYPNSAALRNHSIDRQLLETNLKGARNIRIDGPKVIVE